MNQDIFLVRLRQLVWKQLQSTPAFASDQHQASSHQLNKAISLILEENGFKDVRAQRFLSLQICSFTITIYIEQIIRNAVINIHDRASLTERKSKTSVLPTYARTSQYEPCDHIRQARMHWENGILEELRAIVHEAKRPFLLLRYLILL